VRWPCNNYVPPVYSQVSSARAAWNECHFFGLRQLQGETLAGKPKTIRVARTVIDVALRSNQHPWTEARCNASAGDFSLFG